MPGKATGKGLSNREHPVDERVRVGLDHDRIVGVRDRARRLQPVAGDEQHDA